METSYDYLFEDTGPTPEVDPSELVDVVPGVSYTGDMHKHTVEPQQTRLWHMQEDDKKIAKYGSEVSRWIDENEATAESNLSTIEPPNFSAELLPDVDRRVLNLFTPLEKRPRRKNDAVNYTTERFIDAMRPGSHGEESFVKKILPPNVTIGEAITVFDKDQRYRDAAAAACYKIMDQLDTEGQLDAYDRVKRNSDFKSVNHGDTALQRGRNRDVVVGMTLDMLSGRFNATENRETSRALGDNDRDAKGVFRGGHHSGVAFQVMHILTDPARYDEYLGNPISTPETELSSTLGSKEFLDGVATSKPLYDAPSVNKYNQLPGKVEAHMQTFEFTPHLYSEVAVDPGGTGRPVSIKRGLEYDTDNNAVRGLLIRDTARAAVVENTILNRAGGLGVRLKEEELAGLVSHLSRMIGAEKFVPEGEVATIGRSLESTIPLTDAGDFVSRNHAMCWIDSTGKISVRDQSTNGSILSYQ